MTFRSLGAIAVLVPTLAIVAACSSNDPVPSDPPTSSPVVSPSPETAAPTSEDTAPSELWDQALTATALAGQATIDAQLITNVEGFERITQGEGFVDVTSGAGDITWRDDRSSTREVRSPTGHYLELDGTWFSVERDLPTTVAFEPLEGLGGAFDVVVDGSEDVFGIPATKLTAELPPDAAQMGFSEEELTVFDPTTGTLQATIWVDDDGIIVRVLREYVSNSSDGDVVESISLYVLQDFGASQVIDIPETADAIPAPA
ncbi:MAG TPA: hypothetical protein VGP37_02360 [Candidatus Nanopelagicales bacterium]|nr:hypothetical protein [Candidatus Nanopelagicales bacterium]